MAIDLAASRPIGNIYCGTCSWTDRTLIESGGFYAADIRSPAARLRYYAQVFPMVEVDATATPCPRSRTRGSGWSGRRPTSSATSRRLPMHIEKLRPLAEAGKLGYLLLQFPPWFRKNQRRLPA